MSEREFSPSVALLKIEKIIHSLNLSAVTHHIDKDKLVATAQLFDKNHTLIEAGAGKGPNSLIGALAESIEHLSTFQLNEDDRSIQRCGFIASQKAAECDGFLTSLPCRSELIDCFRLKTLNETEELLVPSTLLSPLLKADSSRNAGASMQFLTRYSSNSGTAFGCTKAEALLHGINEVIERHVLSRFFMAICAIGPAMKLYSPSKDLLARSLQNNPSALERAHQLQIIIIKDVMNVYFSVAIPKSGPGEFHLSPIGSGCSLDICTAIQRATTEQFQVHELYDDAQEAIDRRTLAFLTNSSKLKHLVDLQPVKNTTPPILDSPLTNFTTSIHTQLDILKQNLSNTNRTIFHRVVAQYSDNGIVCQAYIPGLERFNLIRNGYLVAPQRVLGMQESA